MDARLGGDITRSTPARPAPGRSMGDPVTAGLQQMFAAVAAEPIPDDFMRLLDEIEAGLAKGPKGDGTAS